MGSDFDYGFDLNAFVSSEFGSGFDDECRDSEGDTLLRGFDDFDEEYVEFDEEFDL